MGATMRLILTPAQCDGLAWPLGSIAYVKSYDIEAGVRGWMGEAELTLDPAEAVVWESKVDAFQAWRAQSVKHPMRPDGRPNRPLSAYTAEIVDTDVPFTPKEE